MVSRVKKTAQKTERMGHLVSSMLGPAGGSVNRRNAEKGDADGR
jgi:hypothetical protein